MTCPCHALLIATLVAGSAAGAFVSHNIGWVGFGLAVLFGFSLYMGSRARRAAAHATEDTLGVPERSEEGRQLNGSKGEISSEV